MKNKIEGSYVRVKGQGKSIYEILEDLGDECLLQGSFGQSKVSTKRIICDECSKPIRECLPCEECGDYHCHGCYVDEVDAEVRRLESEADYLGQMAYENYVDRMVF